MTALNIVQYLANVITIIRANGKLTPAEDLAFVSICEDIGAKKKECKDAEKLALQDGYQATPTGRYSDSIRNIEDMIYVALADGEICDEEKMRIVVFAKQIDISQDQIDKIFSEVESRVKAQVIPQKCPKCGAQCQSGAKFCPACGIPIQAAPESVATKLEFEYPNTGVAIEFPDSTASSFQIALPLAKHAPEFQQIERAKKAWYLAAWPSGTLADAIELVRGLSGIRNRKVFIDGKEEQWDEVFGFLWCCEQRNTAYRPAEYCFGVDEKRPNLWGCKHLRLDWTEWADWFTYGKWSSKDTFSFDKQRIAHELETNAFRWRFCPHLRRDLLQAVMTRIPDQVRVGERTGWKYKENYEQTPNAIKIVQTRKEDGYSFTNEFFTDGVKPVGFELAKSILKQAFAECGISDVDIRTILP